MKMKVKRKKTYRRRKKTRIKKKLKMETLTHVLVVGILMINISLVHTRDAVKLSHVRLD